MNIPKLTMVAAAAALAGCAAAQPHGVVVLHQSVGGGDIHPVKLAAIDGVNIPGDRQSVNLAPGSHTLTVIGVMKQAHLRSPALDNVTNAWRDPGRQVLAIEVEEGRRYTIAARHLGPRASDWEPIVLRAEPIRR